MSRTGSCQRSCWLLLLLILTPFAAFIFAQQATVGVESACADFNHGAAQAVRAGLPAPFICPKDGIAKVHCDESFPVRNFSDIVVRHVNTSDIVMYLVVGPTSKWDALRWWIALVQMPIDLVLVADHCVGAADTCSDHAMQIHDEIERLNPLVHMHIIRGEPQDSGYPRLTCKVRTGMRKTFELFPDRKYYLKLDTDTIIFPRRLLRFLSAFDSVAAADTQPLYFGTVVESGMNMLLCGHSWSQVGDVAKGGICYAQGGAGYGLNHIAMRSIAALPPCSQKHPDQTPEDVFTALNLYDRLGVKVIHCGAFSSSELVSEYRFKNSISFHYIDWAWLQRHGEEAKNHYVAGHGWS